MFVLHSWVACPGKVVQWFPLCACPPNFQFTVVSSVQHISDHCGVCTCESCLWWWNNSEDKHISELSWCDWSL